MERFEGPSKREDRLNKQQLRLGDKITDWLKCRQICPNDEIRS
jgi:hypothetical protein